jgi:hypothetical protein
VLISAHCDPRLESAGEPVTDQDADRIRVAGSEMTTILAVAVVILSLQATPALADWPSSDAVLELLGFAAFFYVGLPIAFFAALLGFAMAGKNRQKRHAGTNWCRRS